MVGKTLVAAPVTLLLWWAPALAQTPLTTTLVASGLDEPVFAVAPAADFQRLFVVELTGKIRILETGGLLPTPFLDLSGIVQQAPFQGLCGMAFHPDYESNGFFYVYYTGLAQNSILERYQVSANPEVADLGSGVIILDVPQPMDGHEGGTVAFGPDGYLYLALGDGEPQNDQNCNAQNNQVLLGKMVRIDVDGGSPYAIPADNPFVGNPNVLDEIWASGLRHPWRFSFDRATGDMYLGDNGQDLIEELDFEPAGFAGGRNYGWPVMEGSDCFALNMCSAGLPACGDAAYTSAMYEYDHTVGCSVIGGYVYRGCAIPDLQGTYFFGDFCGTATSGGIYSFRQLSGSVTEFQDRTAELKPGALSIQTICSFAEDAFGELYVIDHDGGELFKIIPATAPSPCIGTLSPTSGPAQGGVTVTIIGSAFSGATDVIFGGVAGTNLSVINDSQLTIDTPPGLGAVDVVVTNAVDSTTLVGGYTQVPAGAFVDIGPSGIPGISGEPVLVGSGDLTPGSLAGFTITCTDAPPSTLGFVFLATMISPTPFFGGTFYPFPWVKSLAFPFNAGGAFSATTTVPPSFPGGTSVALQFFFQDVLAIFGVSGSNGLRLDIP